LAPFQGQDLPLEGLNFPLERHRSTSIIVYLLVSIT
jgi:hypothetical protein